MEIRRATDGDRPQLAETLARAFADDPVVTWLATPKAYARGGTRTFAAALKTTYLPKAEVYSAGEGKGVVIWVPPDKWKAPATDSLRLLPAYRAMCGRRLPRVLKLVTAMEKRHATIDEPHWYIPFIATDPAAQGKGLGSALLEHVLEKADAEGRPAYLEATSPRNKLLYHRHGFVPMGDELRVADSPPLTPMWRTPR
ncbi:MAG TPA: GNAT family N-acetyltransferase [Acidimicrobiales bacterium]|nr:GNAT family N-acetyltransferase [Acidimicrobiales bacterium]